MLRINEERFTGTLEDLALIGRLAPEEGGGLDRRPFSAADRAAREYVARQAEAAGLEVRMDAAANLSARLPAASNSARTLLFGSHLDTVPNGGPYDGALGVASGLELLRTVAEARASIAYHLELISFTDEEGRFGDFFGSRALVGQHTTKSIEEFVEQANQYPADLAEMRQITPGRLSPEAILAARRDPATIAAFVELHIEQGPQLERAGVPIGIVDAIFGRRSMRLELRGRSDHAGTTPLPLRADALVAAARFVAEAPVIAQARYPEAVVTCGNVIVKPGVYNVVPNQVTVLVEFRAATGGTLASLENALLQLAEKCAPAAHGLSVVVYPNQGHEPVPMDPAVRDAIRHACQILDYSAFSLSSGALHDAGSLASIAPSGMIMVPSIGGRSHCPEEDTSERHLISGANVLLHTVMLLAERG
jgi:N-carbamoyl-L-amino-acid hydrolase